MPTLELDFEVWCSCGEGLCNQSEATNKHGRKGIIVEPCKRCMEKERDAGESDGYDRGLEDGREDAT